MSGASIGELIAGCGLPRQEALALMAQATGRPREWLIAHDRDAPAAGARALFDRWVKERCAGKPLAYLVGWREFYGRRFWVNQHTLIPRIETELLVDTALQILGDAFKGGAQALTGSANQKNASLLQLCELGTGSGCIAISMALQAKPSTRAIHVTATDRSVEALQVARNNAAWLGADQQITFAQGDWWQALARNPELAGQRFHGVVSNPPYIRAGDAHLSQGDLRHEPSSALVGGDDGLADIKAIVAGAVARLEPKGFLLIEHGFDQQAEVRDMFSSAGLTGVRGLADLAGQPRAVLGFQPQE